MTSPQCPCPICAANNTHQHLTTVVDFEYGVVPSPLLVVCRCLDCGSDFLAPRPTTAEIASYYPDHYHAYHDDHSGLARALVALRSRSRARFYRKLLGDAAGRLFDVGAGDCRHFDALKPFCSLEFCGVEINAAIAAKARSRGYDVQTGTLETMDIDRHIGRYDIVSMNHVIEHVLEPRVMLERACMLLKPGGFVLGQLPARDCWEEALAGRYWAGYHYPRHLQAFSYGGLRQLLADKGFVNIAVRSAPHIQAALSVQNRLIGSGWHPPMQFGKTPIYSWLILAVLPFETLAWLAGKGGIMNFIARKPREDSA